MNSSIFITILSGVTVFIVGQIIMKCALEPYVAFKEQTGKISSLLLREQAKITNGNANLELVFALKEAAAVLIAKSKAVPCYSSFSMTGLLPPYNKVIEAAQYLNLIASMLEQYINPITTPPDSVKMAALKSFQIYFSKISDNLNIVVTYEIKP